MKGWLLEKDKDSPDETESAHTDRLEVDITRGNLKNLSMEKAHPSASVALSLQISSIRRMDRVNMI